MAIRKRSINDMGNYSDYQHLTGKYNESNEANFSHLSNVPTNYSMKTITLTDIDQAVFLEFNNRFKIGQKIMPVLLLDAETSSLINQNYIQYDTDKGFINLPLLTMIRTEDTPLGRTNPSNKQVLYAVPKQKKNGIVIEEYISETPLEWELSYELVFVTNFREYTNEMQAQMREYFRNKANIVVCQNERFPIRPLSQKELGSLDMLNKDDAVQKTLYVSTYKLKLWCFTRDMNNVQKRERPNTYTVDITVNDGLNTTTTTETMSAEQVNVDIQFPDRKSTT